MAQVIAFRTDASLQIGTGHVMRCLTLADALAAEGAECVFICRAHEGNLIEFIRSRGYVTHALPFEHGASNTPTPVGSAPPCFDTAHAHWLCTTQAQDAEACAPILAAQRPEWLIVDHYSLDTSWECILASYYNKLMVIDDLADRHHECELLLDQNLGRIIAHYDRLVPKDCRRLIGPEYALLRPEFAELRARSLKRREHSELKRILISLGGADQTNVTGKVLEALAAMALPEDIELDIIMGISAPHLEEVRQQSAMLPCRATVNVNVSDMAERMCLADLSIGAAGSTSWERCCLGLPAATVILAHNQCLIANALIRSGAAVLLQADRIAEVLAPLLKQFVESTEALRSYAKNAAAVCNGGGTARVVSMLTGNDHA